MKHEIISCVDGAYKKTLSFAREIHVNQHTDSCIRTEMKALVIELLVEKTQETTSDLDNGYFTDLETFVEVLSDALRESVPVISVGTRRGDVLIVNVLNAWMPETVDDAPNALRLKLLDLALYYVKQLEIQTEQVSHNLQDVFELCTCRNDNRIDLEDAEEIAPGINAGIYLKGEADRDIMNTPWMLFFYQLVLQYKKLSLCTKQ